MVVLLLYEGRLGIPNLGMAEHQYVYASTNAVNILKQGTLRVDLERLQLNKFELLDFFEKVSTIPLKSIVSGIALHLM